MKRNKLPNWVDSTLEGLAYWLGYNHELFHQYPLSEGAITAEVLRLISRKLEGPERVDCEVMIKNIIGNGLGFNQERVDIVIKNEGIIIAAIEVKRYQATRAMIDSDLHRLSEIKRNTPDISCFLLLASEKKRPKEFVNESGESIKKLEMDYPFKVAVRRVCKAGSSFRNYDAANYACLIEVM